MTTLAALAAVAALAACGPPPGLEEDPTDAPTLGSRRVARDGNDLAPEAVAGVAGPGADEAGDPDVPEELTIFSSVDDLLHVMQGQAAHLMEAGEVARDRIEAGAPDSNVIAAADRAGLANLAEGAQEAAATLGEVIDEVAHELGVFIPAGATGSNQRVIEKLARVDAKRFPDLYVEEQLGTLERTRRAIKATKRAFKLHPKCLLAFERAASRINQAFDMFDFVKDNAVSAIDDPVQALRFGVGMVDKAGELFHHNSADEAHSEGDGELGAEGVVEAGGREDAARAEAPRTPLAQAA